MGAAWGIPVAKQPHLIVQYVNFNMKTDLIRQTENGAETEREQTEGRIKVIV
jgi:hypothetical protein